MSRTGQSNLKDLCLEEVEALLVRYHGPRLGVLQCMSPAQTLKYENALLRLKATNGGKGEAEVEGKGGIMKGGRKGERKGERKQQ